MIRRVKLLTSFLVVAGLALAILAQDSTHAVAESGATAGKGPEAGKEAPQGQQQPFSASHAAREEKAIQDARRQQLTEKETALAAKEQELRKLSAKLEAQVKALEESKKKVDESMKARSEAQKKQQDEKVQKMVKLFKTMRGEQAGQLIDSLHEDLALALLNRLDTKTVAKLAPFINQPRVVKWISENLQGK
jgi:flagellar motility protein MotE (MotC chaperone)